MTRIQRILIVSITLPLLCASFCGLSETAFQSAEFILPEGYSIFDSTWISGETENVFLLIGSKNENLMKLAVASRTEQQTYRLVACSKPILYYEDYVSDASYMEDPWLTGNPYFWWGATETKTKKEIYIIIEMNESHEWYVSYGFVADSNGNTIYSFAHTDNNSISVSGETPFPVIRWRTNGLLLLEDFDINAVETMCLDALSIKEVLQDDPCFIEFRIE